MLNINKKAGTEVPQSTTTDVPTSSQTIAKPIVGGSFVITTDKNNFFKKEYKNHFASVFEDNYNDYEKAMSKDAKACKNCSTYYWNGCKKRCLCQ
jgi:hypothetical protein